MRRITIIGLLMAGLVGFGAQGVAAASSSNGVKFGYVDFQKALNSVSEGKKARASLQEAFKKRQAELDALQAKLKKEREQLDKDRLVLSDEALRKKEEEYRQRFLDVTKKMNSYKIELANREAESTGEILGALRKVVEEIGAKRGYSMILEKSQNVVLFSPADADLTAEVIDIYNKLPKSRRRLKMH